MRYAPIVALLLVACSPKEYRCQGDTECVAGNATFGLCLDSHCAFPDQACTGGYRFDDAAGDQAKICVSAAEVGAHQDAGPGHDGPVADARVPDGPATDAP